MDTQPERGDQPDPRVGGAQPARSAELTSKLYRHGISAQRAASGALLDRGGGALGGERHLGPGGRQGSRSLMRMHSSTEDTWAPPPGLRARWVCERHLGFRPPARLRLLLHPGLCTHWGRRADGIRRERWETVPGRRAHYHHLHNTSRTTTTSNLERLRQCWSVA